MNAVIAEYFSQIETHFITSPIVASYVIARKNISFSDGKFRARLTFINQDFLELFEYVTEKNGTIQRGKYSFHWQKKDGMLVKRWDNAPHFPDLPNAPHHIHLEDKMVQPNNAPPSALTVLNEIEQELLYHGR